MEKSKSSPATSHPPPTVWADVAQYVEGLSTMAGGVRRKSVCLSVCLSVMERHTQAATYSISCPGPRYPKGLKAKKHFP